jgi:hypothetical protein
MYILDFKRLRPADILFTREKWGATSIGIRAASGSRFSHAILLVDAYSYIDSDRDGVHANNPQYNLFDSPNDVAVKRYKHPMPAEIVNAICDFARSEIGKRYSVPDTFGTVMWWREGVSRPVQRQYCSRLVAMSYAHAHIDLVRNPLRCTPNRVYRSHQLLEVTDVCREATGEDLAIVARRETSLLPKQEEITNKLFADVRAATNSSVETFSDLAELVMGRPETDEVVASILMDSGYLSMWELMRARDPHWYDTEAYARVVPIEKHTQIADESYGSVVDSLRRHHITLDSLSQALSKYPRKTLAALRELEAILIALEEQSLNVLDRFRTKRA